jgi:glutamate racemase
VVLACTHFPLLCDELQQVFGPHVQFVDGAKGIARRIVHLTADQQFARTTPDLALFTRAEDSIAKLTPALAGYGLERVEVLQ